MDISAPSPISAQATLAAHTPARKAPDPSTVPPSDGIAHTRTDPQNANGHGQTDLAADARQQLALRAKLRDPSTPTGPPPTFQFTLLEVEQDLRNILARIEAARSQERDATALRPAGEGDSPPLSNETSPTPAGSNAPARQESNPAPAAPEPDDQAYQA